MLIPHEILTCMDCVTIASCKSKEILREILVIMFDLIAYFKNYWNSIENQTISGSLAKRVLQNKKTKMHTKYECFCPTRFHHLENSWKYYDCNNVLTATWLWVAKKQNKLIRFKWFGINTCKTILSRKFGKHATRGQAKQATRVWNTKRWLS